MISGAASAFAGAKHTAAASGSAAPVINAFSFIFTTSSSVLSAQLQLLLHSSACHNNNNHKPLFS
jgi:hypothetical protein